MEPVTRTIELMRCAHRLHFVLHKGRYVRLKCHACASIQGRAVFHVWELIEGSWRLLTDEEADAAIPPEER